MEKSAKRLSSIFSLGSTSSDKSNNDRNRPPSVHSPHDLRTSSPPGRLQISTSTLQPSASSPNLRTPTSGTSPRLSLSFDPTHPSSRLGHNALPPGVHKPLPLPPGSFRGARPQSATGSRPTSPIKNFSRPSSSPGSGPASPSKDFLQPLTPSSETGRPSRPTSTVGHISISRPTSPVKHLARPATPTSEKKLSKRRSWMPSRSKQDSSEVLDGAHTSPQAWLLAPDQQRPYDASTLVTFQRVSNTQTII